MEITNRKDYVDKGGSLKARIVISLKLDSRMGRTSKYKFAYGKEEILCSKGPFNLISIAKGIITVRSGSSHRDKKGITIISTTSAVTREAAYFISTDARVNVGGYNIILFKENTRQPSFLGFLWGHKKFETIFTEDCKELFSMKDTISSLIKNTVIPDAYKYALEFKDI